MASSSPDDSGEIHRSIRRALNGYLKIPWRARRLHGDASTRIYYRLTTADERSTILTVYDGDEDQRSRFLATREILRSRLCVPEVLLHAEHFVLQQDLGHRSLSSILGDDPELAATLYEKAVTLISRFHSLPHEATTLNPRFDAVKFFSEMEMTIAYYVERLNEISDFGVLRSLHALFEDLSESLAAHPTRICHRDFHGDNLYVVNDELYVIDFQDTRLGPDTYDLASLIRDRGAVERLGRSAEMELLSRYAALVSADERLESRYWEALLQRSIKIIGTFSMQAITRRRRHYLDYVPPALRAIRESVEHLPQYRSLLSTFPMAPAL